MKLARLIGVLPWAVAAPSAWASYGQMRLDGLAFVLVVIALDLWAPLLVLGLAIGWGRHKAFVIAATAITGLLAALLIGVSGDGGAAMRQRPLGGWAMFAALSMAAVPALLLAPLLQYAWHAHDRWRRAPLILAIVAVTFIPVGTVLHLALQAHLEGRVYDGARAVAPGQIRAHVDAARKKAANSPLPPFLWNEEAETKWLALGLSQLGAIDNASPLPASDTEGLVLLVTAAAGTSAADYTGLVQGKLVWDKVMRAAPGERAGIAATLTKSEARQFNSYFGVRHTDWLCTPLAEPDTAGAIDRIWALLSENERNEFSAAVQQKCGRKIGSFPPRQLPPGRMGTVPPLLQRPAAVAN
jgi:hypothetical protein